MKLYIAIAALSFGLSCSQNDVFTVDANKSKDSILERQSAPLSSSEFPVGTMYSKGTVSTQGAYKQLIRDLNKNKAISIVAEVDHAMNAKSVGLNLNDTQIVFFGNPVLGTPLMHKNQLAGLDLPQKVLFYRKDDNVDLALYNSVSYLKSRYNLEDVTTLPKIENALDNLVSSNTKGTVMPSSEQSVSYLEGIITKQSNRSFEESYTTLKNALEDNPNLRVIAELDHQANAASVGLLLRPTRIIIFGNPKLGTPLMQSEQSIGLDLPQKMLFWEAADGTINISYNDINYLIDRHDIDGNIHIISTIETALDNLSDLAAGL